MAKNPLGNSPRAQLTHNLRLGYRGEAHQPGVINPSA